MRKTLIAALLLAGCSTTATMDGIMGSWQGASIDSVVKQWGYPSEEREFRGRKLYVWHYTKSGPLPSATTATGSYGGGSFSAQSATVGGGTITGQCSRTLEVDDAGKVVKWQWAGNNCPFTEAFEYAAWRNPAKPK